MVDQSSPAFFQSSTLPLTTLPQPSTMAPFFNPPLLPQTYPPQAPPVYGSSVYQQYQSANKARRLMPPPPVPNSSSFPPTSLPTPQPLKRPRDCVIDDADEPNASTILPPKKKRNQSRTNAEQRALKGKRPAVGGAGDDRRAVLSAPSSRRRRPKSLDPEDEKKFKELSIYCSSPLRNFIRETYGSPTPAGPVSDGGAGSNQGQANESCEGGSEGTVTGGSTPS